MTDLDDQEKLGPEALPDDAGDPAAAFDVLRQTVEGLAGNLSREMTTIRKGVEAAFDQLEKIEPPEDYKPQLAQVVRELGVVAERLQGVEQSSILRQGPEHYARVLERSGEGLVRTAVQQFERQASELERVGQNLAAHVVGARKRHVQNWWLLATGLAGIVAGVVFTLFVPAILPFSAAPRVASIVMGQRPWDAGMGLMALGSPDAWERVVSADQLVEANKAEVAACREAAAKTKKDQKCTIVVIVPEK